MAYTPGSTIHVSFATRHPSTRALADADATPTVAVHRDGVLDATVEAIVTHRGIGEYGVSVAIPASWLAGETVELRRTAAVAGTPDVDSVYFVLGSTPGGTYAPGDAIARSFDLHDPVSGGFADADAEPELAVYRNGTLDAEVVPVLTHPATGIYAYTVAIPDDYAAGDTVEVRKAATVGGLADLAWDHVVLGSASTAITWDGYFATDADVAAAVSPADYARIAPDNQIVAAGVDGVIPEGGFTFTSASNPDFEARGVLPGMVLRTRDRSLSTTDLFVVSAVDGPTLTLRRIGLPDGAGVPPSSTVGTTNIRFDVPTFRRQLEVATEWLSSLTRQTPGSTSIPTRMLHATVAKVAADAYTRTFDATQMVDPGTHGGGPWLVKAAKHRADLQAELSLIVATVVEEAAAEADGEGAAAALASSRRAVSVTRYDDPDDWIVPKGH